MTTGPKTLRAALQRQLDSGMPVMSYDNGYRVQAVSKTSILDLLATFPEEPTPVASRERVADVLREFGHEESDSDNGWVLFADDINDFYTALLAAGVFRDETEVKAEARQQAARSIRDDAVDEAVDGQIAITAVIRMCQETGR
jgi:hypothetical protein